MFLKKHILSIVNKKSNPTLTTLESAWDIHSNIRFLYYEVRRIFNIPVFL